MIGHVEFAEFTAASANPTNKATMQSLGALLLLLVGVAAAALPYMTDGDKRTLKNQFAEAFVTAVAGGDMQSAFHAYKGLEALGEKVDAKLEEVGITHFSLSDKLAMQKLCAAAQTKVAQAKDVMTANYVAATAAALKSTCKLTATDGLVKLAKDALAQPTPASSDVFYAASTLKALGQNGKLIATVKVLH